MPKPPDKVLVSEAPVTERPEGLFTLSPDEYAEKLDSVKMEAARLTNPFAECTIEDGVAGQHSFIDASRKQDIRMIFQFYKELEVPNTSACLLVPEWPNARFNHYLKGAQLLKQYPARFMHKYPVKLVYLASKPAQLGTLGDDTLTMTFAGSAAGYPALISADSQASHVFVSPEWIKRANVHVTPIADSVELGDGRSAKIVGTCSLRVSMGPFVDRVNASVLQSFAHHHDIILGDDFLKKYKVHLNFEQEVMKLTKGQRRYTISSYKKGLTQGPKELRKKEIVVLSALQAKRALRKSSEDAFLVIVREPGESGLDPEGLEDPLDSLNAGEEGGTDHIAEGPCDKAAVQQLLEKYKHVSPDELPGYPPERGIEAEHVIKLVEGAMPPVPRRYRMSPRERAEVEDHVGKLLAKGLAQPSTSPYGAPILFVPKPDGTLRLVVDYRSLNKITVKDKYPIPHIADLIDQLRDAKVFSALDLTQGYYQLRIAPEDVHKTAFTTHIGLYEYKVLPMGLSNSVSVFQRAMTSIFAPYIGKFVCVYLDDILIYSKTAEEHMEHLETVLKLLEKHKLYIRMHKCIFNAPEVKYLGHIVGRNQVKPDPKKIQAVAEWPLPENIHQLRAFLGLVNYFSKFIDRHAATARPLTELLRKGVPYSIHTPERVEAFESLKKALINAPVLTIPDLAKPFKVIADASNFDMSGILLQDEKPVAYESRKFKPAECNYPVHEREMLAAIHCLRVWRCYLDGQQFELFTDHKPLLLVEDQPHLSSRQARWMQFLALFDIKWHYLKGKHNPADCLTRMPAGKMLNVATRAQAKLASGGEENSAKPDQRSHEKSTPRPEGLSKNNAPPRPTPSILTRVAEATESDPWFQNSRNTECLEFKDGVYYMKDHKLVIPNDPVLRRMIMAEHHNPPSKGHPGVNRTIEHILRHYWWSGLYKDVTEYVKCCEQCQRNKSRTVRPGGLMEPLPIPTGKWESVGMDFIVGLPCSKEGYDAILVVIDRLSKMVHLIPTTMTVTAPEVAKLFVENIVKLHGVPESIVSDRDHNFTSHFWKTVCEMWNMAQDMSTAFHPQTDGQTERVNRVLEEYLRSYVGPLQDDWDSFLPMAEFAMNDSHQKSIGMSPFYMNYGCHPRMPTTLSTPKRDNPSGKDYVENIHSAIHRAKIVLKDAQNKQKQYADKKRREVSFKPGDRVLLSTANLRLKVPGTQKLLPRYIGPFVVEKQVGKNAYRLSLPSAMKVHPVFNVSLLHAYKTDGQRHPPPPIYFDEGLPFYEVERVLQHRTRKSGKRTVNQYLIKWQGYGHEHNTWEPERHLNKTALDSYWIDRESI